MPRILAPWHDLARVVWCCLPPSLFLGHGLREQEAPPPPCWGSRHSYAQAHKRQEGFRPDSAPSAVFSKVVLGWLGSFRLPQCWPLCSAALSGICWGTCKWPPFLTPYFWRHLLGRDWAPTEKKMYSFGFWILSVTNSILSSYGNFKSSLSSSAQITLCTHHES